MKRWILLCVVIGACGRKPHRPADFGNLACWGNNTLGQLGDFHALSLTEPRRVDGYAGATDVTVTSSALCARTAAGVLCRGDQLGLGPTARTPTLVPALADAVQIQLATRFGCVRNARGGVACWGANLVGQLGRGDAPDPSLQVPIKSDRDGTITIAGDLPANAAGALAPVAALTEATAIAVGSSFACAIRPDARVVCWGDGGRGQLGDGREGAGVTSPTPADVPGLTDVSAIDAGSAAACAVASGAVYCWGLLDDPYGSRATWTTPTKIAGVADAVDVQVVETQACARTRDGAVACWDKTGQAAPIALPKVVQLVGGFRHYCARTEAGAVHCWGDDANGQLGGSSPTSPVPGLPRVKAMFVGDSSSCALLAT